MASNRDWRSEEGPTTRLPDLTEVATGLLPDRPDVAAGPIPEAPSGQPRASELTDASALVARALPQPTPPKEQPKRRVARARPRSISKQDATRIRGVQDQCRKLCLSLFYREPVAIRSLGFTSSVAGEGKTFLSTVTAGVLAADAVEPVVLVECNWEHPVLHEFFELPAAPGLAEWLRQECSEMDIRHRVGPNLVVIPAGEGVGDAVRLLLRLRDMSSAGIFMNRPERYIFDLPPVVSCSYGALAAALAEAVVVVVQAGVTPDSVVAEACAQLEDIPIEGIVLNQIESRIPRWIRRIL
jgi:Mrp family chromosome partitioning ATPase